MGDMPRVEFTFSLAVSEESLARIRQSPDTEEAIALLHDAMPDVALTLLKVLHVGNENSEETK